MSKFKFQGCLVPNADINRASYVTMAMLCRTLHRIPHSCLSYQIPLMFSLREKERQRETEKEREREREREREKEGREREREIEFLLFLLHWGHCRRPTTNSLSSVAKQGRVSLKLYVRKFCLKAVEQLRWVFAEN